eukprot:COSAG02_NODE_3191_length_7197_cov_28.589321_4_plen_112_part_00
MYRGLERQPRGQAPRPQGRQGRPEGSVATTLHRRPAALVLLVRSELARPAAAAAVAPSGRWRGGAEVVLDLDGVSVWERRLWLAGGLGAGYGAAGLERSRAALAHRLDAHG